MGNSIIEILKQTADTDGERLCVVDWQGEHTYKRIWDNIVNVAWNLKGLGVQARDCIMVECTQDARFLVCDFACNLLGAYFVPIEHKAALERVRDIESETEAKLFIYDNAYELACQCVNFAELMKENSQRADWVVEFPESEAVAEILYTTGTTGKSKGIEVTHANNIALAENIAFGTRMREGNVELIPLPISHSHGLRCCYANLYRQGTVVLIDGVTKVKEIFELIIKYEIKALDLSPTAATVLLKLSRNKFGQFDGHLDYIQIGTAALPEELKESLRNLLPSVRLYNFYGSTESGRSCVLDFNSPDDRKFCIGRPTKNAHFIVTDEERNEIQSSQENTGLLACAGPMNMKGYWKQPELTASTMRNGYIYTNDEAYIDEEGFVYVLGRHDDIINYKGIKIAPEEIEESARLYPEVVDCACVPKADKMSGQIPKLFLMVKDAEAFDKKDFMHFLEGHIDANKMPTQLAFVDEIPRASNGKIQRKKLME